MSEKNELLKNELEILFPDETVTINGVEVIMRPLPLEKLPMILKQFRGVFDTILQGKAEGLNKEEVVNFAVDLSRELVGVLPHCLFRKNTDGDVIPLNAKIPAKAAYDLMSLFIKQNIPEELVGKIKALISEDVSPNQEAKD